MRHKRFISFLSAAAIACSALPSIGAAAEEEETLLYHQMATEEEVSSVMDGYIERIASDKGTAISWTNAGGGSMNAFDEGGRYNSSGIKYDITPLVEGKRGQLTISADVRGGYGSTLNAKIGFLSDDDTSIGAYPEQTADGSGGAFTTVSYTAESVPEYTDSLYFFITGQSPTLNVKNVKLTYIPAEPEPAETSAAEITPEPAVTAQPHEPREGEIIIANSQGAAPIYIDVNGAEYDGLSLIAEAAARDIEAVTGAKPEVTLDEPSGTTVIIAGTVDEEIITKEGLSWEIAPSNNDMKSDNWERFQIQVKEDGDTTKIIVAGADKRGTIYGLFHITQDLCGVSPWIWWADVTPERKDTLAFTAEELNCVSKRPSVNYRGIFLNNEAPSLSAYVSNRYGNYNYLFYANVCELMLRLKGNYLWPAMWGNAFETDGILGIENAIDTDNLEKLPEEERDELANARIAEDYGVVIGFSHHEPMIRSGVEWQRLQRYGEGAPNYTKPTKDDAALNEWNYFLNRDNIYDFWKDGITRSGGFDNNLITIGMRGEGDSALTNPDGTRFTLQQNVDLLKEVITDQKEILAEKGLDKDPQMFALYTEVQQYWYGYDADTNQTSDALKDWDALNDDIICLCEDNFGYTRFLTYPDERADRNWGMYYHFDMNGGAHCYKWINTVPLQRTWENMTMSYDYGVDDLWIVNVGDLKPLELPISYFIDLGYDFEKWGTDNPNSTDEYTDSWIRQQLGSVLNDEEVDEVSQIVTDYVDMNGRCKPEILSGSTFSTVYYNEAQRELAKAEELESRAEKYWRKLKDTPLADAYYQLVYYPAAGTANVNKMLIYQGLNEIYVKRGSMLANTYGALVNRAIERDKALLEYYNYTMSGGKWKYMQNQKLHTCYVHWYDDSAAWPEPEFLVPETESGLLVDVIGSKDAYTDGETAALPDFESTELQQYPVTLSTTGGKISYDISADRAWIKFTGDASGSFTSGTTIGVYADFSALSADDSGTITVNGSEGSVVKINVTAKIIDTAGAEDKTYFASNGAIVIGAENYTAKGGASSRDGIETEWRQIENYGKWGHTMKMFPTTETFVTDAKMGETLSVINSKNAPWLEYKINVPEDGEYNVIGCFGHSNNILPDSRLRYGVEIDGGDVTVQQSISDGFGVAGISGEWNRGTRYSGRLAYTKHTLAKGAHTIRIYGYEPDVQLQRIVVTKNDMIKKELNWQGFSGSFFGPEETYYTGLSVSQEPLVYSEPEQTLTIPGTVPAAAQSVIAGQTATYTITAAGEISNDALITVMIDGEETARLTYDAGTETVTASTEEEITAGEHTFSYAVESGTADIEAFVFAANDSRTRIEVVNEDFSDNDSAARFSAYTDGDGILSLSSGGLLGNNFASGWNENNGIKTDITELVKGKSGLDFGASADVYSTAGGDARLFIEAVGADGTKTRYTFASSSSYVDNNLTLKGELEGVDFSGSEKVYLCVTQWSGFTSFDNIKLWFYSERAELFRHTFNKQKGAEVAMYEPYAEGAVAEGGSGTVLKSSKGTSAAAQNGVKINLTEKLGLTPEFSGSVFGASALVKPGYSWGGSNEMNIFFEVVNEAETRKADVGSLTPSTTASAEGFDSETGNSLGSNWLKNPLCGETRVEFDENDTVYLCITGTNDPVWYDDICLYYMTGTSGVSDEPSPPPAETVEPVSPSPGVKTLSVSQPVFEDGKASVAVSNTTDNDAEVCVYAARYDEGGALVCVHSSNAAAKAGEDTTITVEAQEGDKIFVWDENMKPYTVE